jgi:hypothetical protein
VPGARTGLGDARSHLPSANHPDPFDAHGAMLGEQSGWDEAGRRAPWGTHLP